MSNTEMNEEQRAKLAELRTRREALERAREEKALREEPEARLAREERALKDAEALDAAIEKHGPLGVAIEVVETDLGDVIVKRCHSATFRKFQDTEGAKVKDLELIVFPNVVHPASEVFERMLEQQPAILTRCADRVCRLAGVRMKEASGK